jgi:hypothetical protein
VTHISVVIERSSSNRFITRTTLGSRETSKHSNAMSGVTSTLLKQNKTTFLTLFPGIMNDSQEARNCDAWAISPAPRMCSIRRIEKGPRLPQTSGLRKAVGIVECTSITIALVAEVAFYQRLRSFFS